MTVELWQLLLIILTLAQNIRTSRSNLKSDELPLTRSLGYSIRKRLGDNPEDERLSKELMEQYQDMVRASYESFEIFDDNVANGLRRDVGINNLEQLKEGMAKRRRSSRLRSPAGRRRARSQALRRNKLNSQSLKSHQQHSKHARTDYHMDYYTD